MPPDLKYARRRTGLLPEGGGGAAQPGAHTVRAGPRCAAGVHARDDPLLHAPGRHGRVRPAGRL